MLTSAYDPNTHTVPQVNTSLESVLQGLHSGSLWTGRFCGASWTSWSMSLYFYDRNWYYLLERTQKLPPKTMYIRYNNNTHAVLEVDASVESPMQGLHSESLWMGMLCGATLPFDTQSYM